MKNGPKQQNFCTLPTESACSMLMNMPSETRNSHEQQRKLHPTHTARLSGGLGLVCPTPGLDRETASGLSEAKALPSSASDQGAGISGGYALWGAALTGDQPGRSPSG